MKEYTYEILPSTCQNCQVEKLKVRVPPFLCVKCRIGNRAHQKRAKDMKKQLPNYSFRKNA